MASEPLGSALVELGIDLKKMEKGLREARKKLQDTTKKMQNTAETGGKETGKGLGKGIGSSLLTALRPILRKIGISGALAGKLLGVGLIGAAVAAIAVGGVLLVKAFKSIAEGALGSVKAFVSQEKILNRINKILQITGETAGFTSKQLETMATQLQGETIIDDKSILNSQAILLTFTNIAGRQFKKTILAANDLSTAMGSNLREEIIRLAKALSAPEQNLATLRETGIIFTDQQRDMIVTMFKAGKVAESQNLIFQILAENGIGGNAIAAENFTDKLTVLINKLNDFPPLIGEAIVETLGLSKVVSKLSDELDILAVFFGRNVKGASAFQESLEITKIQLRGLKNPIAFLIAQFKTFQKLKKFKLEFDGALETTKEILTVQKALGIVSQAQKNLSKVTNEVNRKREDMFAKQARQLKLNKALQDEATDLRGAAVALKDAQRRVNLGKEEVQGVKDLIATKREELETERRRKPDKSRLFNLSSANDLWKRIQKSATEAGNAEKKAAKDARLDKLKDDLKGLKVDLEIAKKGLIDIGKVLKDEEKKLSKKIKEAQVTVRFNFDLAEIEGQATAAAKIFETAMRSAIELVTRDGLVGLGEFETFFNKLLGGEAAGRAPAIPKVPIPIAQREANEEALFEGLGERVTGLGTELNPVVKNTDTTNTLLERIGKILQTILDKPTSGVFGTSGF